jgi:hypothetical protein
VVAAKIAAGRRLEAERQQWTGASVADDWREYARLEAAGDRRRINGIDEVLRRERCNDLVLHGVGDIGAMADAGMRIPVGLASLGLLI